MFGDQSPNIYYYIRSLDMDDHLSLELSSIDDTNKNSLWDKSWLIQQIKNSIKRVIIGLVNHCEFVKELLEYLEFLYSRKENINWVFDV